MATVKQLSCQSSVEPCVLEEELPELIDDKESFHSATETQAIIEGCSGTQNFKSRPDSLILNTATIEDTSSVDSKKFLYRSQSTKSFKKPKLKASKILSTDLDQIYVISSNTCTRTDLNDFYDSIEVISERRSKNFMEFTENESDNVNNDLNNKKIANSSNVVVEMHGV
jgi:hypothetical protein